MPIVNKRIAIVVLLVVCLAAGLTGCAQRQASGTDVAAPAKGFVELLTKGDFDAATKSFDPTMKQAMSPQQLKNAWTALTTQVGAFQSQVGARTATEQGFDTAYVTCKFAMANVDVKVVFDRQKRISGLWFVPPQPAPAK
jgi:hypothetical protein